MNLFLIGLPGSGKTTLGRELARILQLKLIDTDEEIIVLEGQSIEDIFKNHGEAYFRKVEQAYLHNVSQGKNQLISTGGGMPCFFDNISFMNKNGVSIFIDVPPQTIHQRLIGQRNQKRPMLENKTDEEVLAFITQKYEERFPYYSQASLSISGSNIKVEEIVSELKKARLI